MKIQDKFGKKRRQQREKRAKRGTFPFVGGGGAFAQAPLFANWTSAAMFVRNMNN